MDVGRICSQDIRFVRPDDTVRHAAGKMRDERVGTLLVIDDYGRPAGLVTDRDLVTRVMGPGRDPDTTPVSQVMTARPVSVAEDTPVEAALSLMRTVACRRLVVTDQEGRITGVVSLDDVLTLMAGEFEMISALLARQATRGATAM